MHHAHTHTHKHTHTEALAYVYMHACRLGYSIAFAVGHVRSDGVATTYVSHHAAERYKLKQPPLSQLQRVEVKNHYTFKIQNFQDSKLSLHIQDSKSG